MSRILFCLLPTLACSPAYPLRDGHGAPACGNIGQTGRPGGAGGCRAAPAQPAVSSVRIQSSSLLAAGVNEGAPIARPLLDSHARPAPGNCAGKCTGGTGFRIGGELIGGERPAEATPA